MTSLMEHAPKGITVTRDILQINDQQVGFSPGLAVQNIFAPNIECKNLMPNLNCIALI